MGARAASFLSFSGFFSFGKDGCPSTVKFFMCAFGWGGAGPGFRLLHPDLAVPGVPYRRPWARSGQISIGVQGQLSGCKKLPKSFSWAASLLLESPTPGDQSHVSWDPPAGEQKSF